MKKVTVMAALTAFTLTTAYAQRLVFSSDTIVGKEYQEFFAWAWTAFSMFARIRLHKAGIVIINGSICGPMQKLCFVGGRSQV